MAMAYSRRRFTHLLGAAMGAAAVPAPLMSPPKRSSSQPDRSSARLTIDCLAVDDPSFDPKRAVSAGLSAAIVDLRSFPRTFENAVQALATWNVAFNAPGSGFQRVLTAADLDTAVSTGRFGVILASQDASILGAPADASRNLRLFHDLGLRVLQLTHSDRNAVAEAYREGSDGGLSRLGQNVVRWMNELRMIIDLSHCSDRTTDEAIALSERPCAFTHTGCRSLYDTLRNKSDAQIRALAAKGGVIGIFSMSLWLTTAPRTSVADVVRHIDHVVQLVGIDHVAFSSDGPSLGVASLEDELRGMRGWAERTPGLPGTERVPDHIRAAELNGPDRLVRVAEALSAAGYDDGAVGKIVGGNMRSLIRNVCG